MIAIFCVGDGGSFLFNRRRVSSDKAVIQWILDTCGEAPVCVSAYSAKLFPTGANILVCDDPFEASENVCFIEALPDGDWMRKTERVILFHWNRTYPADIVFPIDELRKRGTLVSSEEFSGNSHERITREVFVL